MRDRYGFFLGGNEVAPNFDLEVTDKYTGEIATRVALADEHTISEAIRLACDAAPLMRELPAYERQSILRHCVGRFESLREELAQNLCIEAGKPIRDSRGEVARLIDTFQIAAEEATRIGGEIIDLEISPRARGYHGFQKRVPIGPCSFIAPFNFPLNLAAHKIAPAIAAGCPFVLKPASRTPVGALMIGEILAETTIPPGAFSILPCDRNAADLLTTDDRLKLLSFTGSPEVGWAMKARAGKKKVVLELGGNAACVVDEDADIEDAVQRILIGAFYQSGQSCIGVQRIMVHEAIYDNFVARLVEETEKLISGDPKEESTFIGPLISLQDAERLERWVQEAKAAGGKLLTGGTRDGQVMHATLLEDVPADQPICAEEAFGPVAVVSKFASFEQAIAQVNDSRFGLQAGIFTRDLYRALNAWDKLEVGGVIVGDIPSWRVDHMPYGGVKDSGMGREGIRYAIDDMTEPRLLVVRNPAIQ